MTDTTTPTVGTMLREARHQAGLSQRQLSIQTGIDTGRISAWENDRDPAPWPAALDTLIDFFSLDRDALYHAAGRVPPEITAALAHDLPLVREIRDRLGL